MSYPKFKAGDVIREIPNHDPPALLTQESNWTYKIRQFVITRVDIISPERCFYTVKYIDSKGRVVEDYWYTPILEERYEKI
jgi:hypothetical protein